MDSEPAPRTTHPTLAVLARREYLDPSRNPVRRYARAVWNYARRNGGESAILDCREHLRIHVRRQDETAVTFVLSMFDGTISTCRYHASRKTQGDPIAQREAAQRAQRKARRAEWAEAV